MSSNESPAAASPGSAVRRPGAVTTILLSRAGVSTRDFLIGSLVGFLPSTLLTVLLAGTAATVLPKGVLAWTSAAVALVAAIVRLVRYRGTMPE